MVTILAMSIVKESNQVHEFCNHQHSSDTSELKSMVLRHFRIYRDNSSQAHNTAYMYL